MILPAPNNCIVVKAPLRISFAGGGTDFPEWFTLNRGAVLSATVNLYVKVKFSLATDGMVKISSKNSIQQAEYKANIKHQYNGQLDLVKATINVLDYREGLKILLDTDVPMSSGLGSSSAFVVALAAGIARLKKQNISNYELAELAYSIERIELGLPGGKQDHYASVFGGINLIEFQDSRITVSRVNLPDNVIKELENNLMLYHFGTSKNRKIITEAQILAVTSKRSNAIHGLKALYQLVTTMNNALSLGDVDLFGALLHQSFMIKRQINPEITHGTIIDDIYEQALKGGAIGGKLLGAGGGGFLLLYCKVDRQATVRAILNNLGGYFLDFGFTNSGVELQVYDEHTI